MQNIRLAAHGGSKRRKFDYVVLGSGMYGLYATRNLLSKGKTVGLVECEDQPFKRASYINQARVHNGYHYPRSYATAIKSARYFRRFCEEFEPAINKEFRKIYGISRNFSLTSGEQFEKFCKESRIPCKQIDPTEYFQADVVDGVFETTEYAYDAAIIKDILMSSFSDYGSQLAEFYGAKVVGVEDVGLCYHLRLSTGLEIEAETVLNATYGSVNQVNHLFGFPEFAIKYEICEIILGKASDSIKTVGITVMDGPFFSMMPFGKTGLHSLTSVTFTPHKTSNQNLPAFRCQDLNLDCTPVALENCNSCIARPASAWKFMRQLSKKYLAQEIGFEYEKSLFSIKPILAGSELDDSRPTLVRVLSEGPRFISVLSGKINTVYDLEEVLV